MPTDLSELTFAGVGYDRREDKPPFGFGLTLLLREEPIDMDRQLRLTLRQEPAPGIQNTLAQVPDLLEERIIPLQ